MRGLTPLDYDALRAIGGIIPDGNAPPVPQALVVLRRLLKEGRLSLDGEPCLTAAGREALRLHEALIAAGVTL